MKCPAKSWVKARLAELRKQPEYRGKGNGALLTMIAHATGLLWVPGSWNKRQEMVAAWMAGEKAVDITAERAARRKRRAPRPSVISQPQARPTRAEFNALYDSKEWLRLRYRVLQHYGRKCMACGATGCEMHVDHIQPRSKRPDLELDFDNLQVLCRACNLGKGGWDATDWRDEHGASLVAPTGEAHGRAH